MFVTVLAVLIAFAAAGCKAPTPKFDLSTKDDKWVAVQAKRACIGDDWLAPLYTSDRSTYNTWVKKEQAKIGLDEVLSHKTLRGCFRVYLGADVQRLDFVEAVSSFRDLEVDAIRVQRGCEILTKFAAVDNAASAAVSKVLTGCGTPSVVKTLPKTAFDEMEKTVKASMVNPSLVSFLSSSTFTDCRQNAPLNEAVRSYPTILNAFCEEEEKTFTARNSVDKTRIRDLITAYLDRRCKEEESFKYP